MRTNDWPPCIVTVFDAIGIKELAASGTGSEKMIELHKAAVEKINNGLPHHSHGYVWNDSVLLLSYETEPASTRQKLLAELNEFKSYLELECKTPMYAISVMGLAFPQEEKTLVDTAAKTSHEPRAVVLRTSSWAMANCFHIEEKLGHYQADWYVDSRITYGVILPPPLASKRVPLFPKKQRRTIQVFKGSLTEVGTE